MRLSVIIVNYNVKYFVEQCLFSVYKALKNIPAEVFVVDNHSSDGSERLIRQKFPQVKFIANTKNVGFSAANNQAIRMASGEFVLLLNPDTVVQEDTFEKTLKFMEMHPEAGALGIKMVDGKGNFLPESKRGLPTPSVAFYKIFGLAKLFPNSHRFGQYHLTYLDKEKNHEVDVLSGAFMLIRKSALDKAGLLDETFFMYGEDIDLSYRIKKAGYKNYYFADSSIIHYKGESTKKSSVNYVIVFYKAMVIFARKHFSQSNAWFFSLLIHMAIYLRAGAAILYRFVTQLVLPAIDIAVIIAGLYLCKDIYEIKFKLYPNFYSREMISVFFPLYALIWVISVFFAGGYDKPVSFRKIVRGVLIGSAFILIVYSLLPEFYRFSRALILIGSGYTVVAYLTIRWLLHLFHIKGFSLAGQQRARIAIIGSTDEFNRVSHLLSETQAHHAFIGHIGTESNEGNQTNLIGTIDRLNDAINDHEINEVIFCAKDISSADIISKMVSLVAMNVEFKIAPPESLSVIGSSSIDSAGELYVIDSNNVGRPENRRLKRLVDIGISVGAILLGVFIIWFQERKGNFILNALRVLAGWYTWVGYGKLDTAELPVLKPSVLLPTETGEANVPENRLNKVLLGYAKDYKPENDVRIVLKNWRRLGT